MFCFSPLEWLPLVFLLQVGNFELDLTSYLFYKFITVVSTIDYCSIMCMVGGLFSFFSALLSGGV